MLAEAPEAKEKIEWIVKQQGDVISSPFRGLGG